MFPARRPQRPPRWEFPPRRAARAAWVDALGVLTIDEEKATGCCSDRQPRHGSRPRGSHRGIAVPENGPFTRTRIHENDREAVGRASDRACRAHVDGLADEARTRQPAEVVVPEGADVANSPAEAPAAHHRRRNLAARHPSESRKFLLGR
jgi:hypothetical protein